MTNLSKQEFVPLDISGKNYLSWAMDIEIHLESMGLGNTILIDNTKTNQDHAKAMIFLHHHLDEGLKYEYLMVKNPYELWNDIKYRFDHFRSITKPNAKRDWIRLRLQDFKSVTEYNSAMIRITSQLNLCDDPVSDEDMLEKTFSTFHVSNIILQQQYRIRGFKKYSELIACLLLAEQNNELLMKNHESRPTGASPFPELNAAQYSNNGSGRGNWRGHGGDRGRGRARGHGRGRYITYHHNNNRGKMTYYKNGNRGTYHDNGNHGTYRNNGYRGKKRNDLPRMDHHNDNEKNVRTDKCHRCGMDGHCAKNCRTNLNHSFVKNSDKNVETNFIDQKDNNDDLDMDIPMMSYLEVADFFDDTV